MQDFKEGKTKRRTQTVVNKKVVSFVLNEEEELTQTNIKDEELKKMDIEDLLKEQELQNQRHDDLMQKAARHKDLSMKEYGLKMKHSQRNNEHLNNSVENYEINHKKKKSVMSGIKGFFKKISKKGGSKPGSE
jgi:hypothetical protein